MVLIGDAFLMSQLNAPGFNEVAPLWLSQNPAVP